MRTFKYYIDYEGDLWKQDQDTGEGCCMERSSGVTEFSVLHPLSIGWKNTWQVEEISEEEFFLEMI